MRKNRFDESDAFIEKKKERTGNLDLKKLEEIFEEIEAKEKYSYLAIFFGSLQNWIMMATIVASGLIGTLQMPGSALRNKNKRTL